MTAAGSIPDVLAIIPARGGSKGVPRKNLREVGGKPLVTWALRAALESGVIRRLVVSTDDSEIAAVCRAEGAEVLERPEELSGDSVLTEPVLLHALDAVQSGGYFPAHVALIQCTSPLLTPQNIRDCVDAVSSGGFDSCITAFRPDGYEFKWREGADGVIIPEHDVDHRPRRQDLNLPLHENGAFYITRTDLLRASGNRFGGASARVGFVEMSEQDSIQVDAEHHLLLIDTLLRQRTASPE